MMAMLYDFSELKKRVLTLTGGKLLESRVNLPRIREKLTLNELKKNVSFEKDGIYIQHEGKKLKGFLYIEKGINREFARRKGLESIVPKFHIYRCKTIVEQMSKFNFHGHYVFANEPVKMLDWDGVEKELMLCRNCLKMSSAVRSVIPVSVYYREYILGNNDGTLGKDDLPLPVERDYQNYASNWSQISAETRKRRHYRCEECGMEFSNQPHDTFFLETHHIDGNKANNRPNNLKTVCVLCHAFIDKHHIFNYTDGKNRLKLIQFLTTYGEVAREKNSKYYQKAIQFLGLGKESPK